MLNFPTWQICDLLLVVCEKGFCDLYFVCVCIAVASTVKQALQDSLVQILQPKRRVDILRDVMEAQSQRRPFVITFCGVNGVGKSTNLAKVSLMGCDGFTSFLESNLGTGCLDFPSGLCGSTTQRISG